MGSPVEAIHCNADDPDGCRDRYREDGVVIIRQALDSAAMNLIDQTYNWRLENLGPLAQKLYPDSGGLFLQDTGDFSKVPVFGELYKRTPIPKIVSELFESADIWHVEDQLFLKEGGTGDARRTPWHQDISYHQFAGTKSATIWISLDDIDEHTALEVVRGSHRGPLYNGSALDSRDDTAPLYGDGPLPRLPNIQANRDNWDIVTCILKRGDLLIFTANTLHGGGSVPRGRRRRTLTLRLMGDDIVRAYRPKVQSDSVVTNNVGEEVKGHARYRQVSMGEPLYKSGLFTKIEVNPTAAT
jgi:hypothetical protein